MRFMVVLMGTGPRRISGRAQHTSRGGLGTRSRHGTIKKLIHLWQIYNGTVFLQIYTKPCLRQDIRIQHKALMSEGAASVSTGPAPKTGAQTFDMKEDTHQFVHNYKGLGAFGMDRKTDEQTVMFYLQKFGEDNFMETFIPRLSDIELEEIYLFVNDFLKRHITEDEYHDIFLKDR